MQINKNKKSNQSLANFYLFLAGQFVSQFGSKMTSYGLILWSYGQTGSVLSTSLLTVCSLLPGVLLSFISGSVSDGWDKKKIMLAADAYAACFSVVVWILLGSGSLQVGHLYVVNVMLGIADSFQSPASEVTVSLLVARKDYMKTSSLRSLVNSFTTILCPVAATSFYAFFGLQVILLVDLASFLFAFFTLAFVVKIKKVDKGVHKKESLWITCKFGIQYIWNEKGIRALILFMAFVNFVVGIYQTNLTPMVLARNGGNEVQLGIVSGAVGVAGIAGSLLVPRFSKVKRRISLILNILSFSFLVCDTLLGIGRNYYLWMIAVFLGNLLIPVMSAHIEYIMRTKVPVEMQGRVFSARNTLQYSALPLGYLAGGLLSDRLFEPLLQTAGPIPSFFKTLTGSGPGTGIAALYLILGVSSVAVCCIFRFSRALRALDREVKKL